VSAAGARLAAARHTAARNTATSATSGSPRGSDTQVVDDREAWLVDSENDTSELSPFATAIVVDPHP
jgi:hypothetical protein